MNIARLPLISCKCTPFSGLSRHPFITAFSGFLQTRINLGGTLTLSSPLVKTYALEANKFGSEAELHYRAVRSTYLVTYSQANLEKFPSRDSFADCVVQAFESEKSKASIQHWVCSMEEHCDGGSHYHMAIKLNMQKRWKAAKNSIHDKHGITVNFSCSHDNYYTAYKYATKEDTHALHSQGHPDLAAVGSPRTKASTKAVRRRSRSRQSNEADGASGTPVTSSKRQRLSNLEVSELVLKKGIKREVELLALANEQKTEGKNDLAEFVLGRSEKSLKELISCTWKMQNASNTLQREKMHRMTLVRQSLAEIQCVEGCGGNWLKCALEVLRQNHVHPYVFAAAVRELLEKRRGKFRNIMIVGPANCGKTFLLAPISKIFATFLNPATTSYAWLGVEDAEVIFLNDFRWSSEVIAWKDFLLLLEGQPIHFPAPKTTYAKDIYLEQDTPIFATSKAPITYIGKYNATDDRENRNDGIPLEGLCIHPSNTRGRAKGVVTMSTLFLGTCFTWGNME